MHLFRGFNILLLLMLLLTTFVFTQKEEKTRLYGGKLRKKFEETRKDVKEVIQNGNLEKYEYDYKLQAFYIFLPREQEALCILQEDFETFLKLFERHNVMMIIHDGYRRERSNFESFRDVPIIEHGLSVETRVRGVLFTLVKKIKENKDFIKTAVYNSDKLEDFEKDFIIYYIEAILYSMFDFEDIDAQLNIIKLTEIYLEKHPSQRYSETVFKYHSKFIEPSWFAIEFNFGGGFGFNTNSMNNYLRNRLSLELDMKCYVHSTFIGARFQYIGLQTKQEFEKDGVLLPEGMRSIAFEVGEFYLGRLFYIGSGFYLLPSVGYSSVHYQALSDKNSVNHGDWGRNHFWTPSFGCELKFSGRLSNNLVPTHFGKFKRNLTPNSVFLRLGATVYHNPIEEKYDFLRGSPVNFYFGIGVHFRKTKRIQLIDPNILNK